MCKKEESRKQWRRFVEGDKRAYTWIYDEYVRSLYRYGLHFTPDGETVKDCIHDVFANLYRNRNRLVIPDNVNVYLLVSLKNSLLRRLRTNLLYECETASCVETAPFLLEPAVEDEYISNEQSAQRRKMIGTLLSVLSPRQKEIIHYRFIRELGWDEICALMSLNYQSAQNLLQRALRKMREKFDAENFSVE
jgi:RNA polymerase sigma factor (sigma-70 family)